MTLKTRKSLLTLVLVALPLTLGACGPSPETMCEHTEEILTAELGEAAVKQILEETDCVEEMKAKKDSIIMKRGLIGGGRSDWTAYRDCVMAADKVEAHAKCDD